MRTSRTWTGPVVVGALFVLASCRFIEPPAKNGLAAHVTAHGIELPALRPLDEAHAAEFQIAFNEFEDRTRYIVSLSPT